MKSGFIDTIYLQYDRYYETGFVNVLLFVVFFLWN